MLKLDNNLLLELGLGALPEEQKRQMLQHIYETLELRVGTQLANQMTDQQLEEFEKFIDSGGDANQAQALKWLETNLPNYKQVVNEVFEALKTEVKDMAPQLLASAAQQSAQPPLPQPAPMPGQLDSAVPPAPSPSMPVSQSPTPIADPYAPAPAAAWQQPAAQPQYQPQPQSQPGVVTSEQNTDASAQWQPPTTMPTSADPMQLPVSQSPTPIADPYAPAPAAAWQQPAAQPQPAQSMYQQPQPNSQAYRVDTWQPPMPAQSTFMSSPQPNTASDTPTSQFSPAMPVPTTTEWNAADTTMQMPPAAHNAHNTTLGQQPGAQPSAEPSVAPPFPPPSTFGPGTS
jgi:hypothetical protein